MWILDAGLLTLNARCIFKCNVKSRLTSCLLLIANNLLNQVICTRILTISLVFWTQMRKENLCRKKISQVSMYVAFLPLPLLGTVNFRQSVNILCWTICWIKHGEAHFISPCLVFAFKSVLPSRCTHNALWWVIMNSYDSTISCWLYLLFMARSARFVLLDGL